MKKYNRDSKGRFCKKEETVYMTGYKAFNSDFSCNPDGKHLKQYKENTVFEENGNKIGEPGMMHFCNDLLSLFEHCGFIDDAGELLTFAEVEALASVQEWGSVYATNRLRVGKKISLKELLSKAKMTNDPLDRIIFNDSSDHIINKEPCFVLINFKDRAYVENHGEYAFIINLGNNSEIENLGERAAIHNFGNNCFITNSGREALISSKGKNAVITAIGNEDTVRGKIGTIVTLTDPFFCFPSHTRTAVIDGKHLKEDVLYKLRTNNFIER